MAKFDNAAIYNITALSVKPLHVGSADGDNSVLIDSVSKKPYIQANSISGAFGGYLEAAKGKNIKENLFGSMELGKSSIIFSDGNIEKNSKGLIGELRPRVSIDGKTATGDNKFEVYVLSEGLKLNFYISLFCKNSRFEKFTAYTEEMIKAFGNGEISLGGQKTNGCSCFELVSVVKTEYNLRNENDRMCWLNLNGKTKAGKNITSKLNCQTEKSRYEIKMKAEIIDSLIVKGIFSFSERNEGNFVDSESINKLNGKYFVPGSSLKGVIKNRALSIAEYMEINKEIVNLIFGRGSEDGGSDTGLISRVIFDDAEIINPKPMLVHRIKIDKFTGSAFGGGHDLNFGTDAKSGGSKFDEIPVTGSFDICIHIDKKIYNKETVSNEAEAASLGKAACGLVMLALRDLGCGVISVGGLSSVGRGFIKGSGLSVSGEGKSFINECLRELDRQRGQK